MLVYEITKKKRKMQNKDRQQVWYSLIVTFDRTTKISMTIEYNLWIGL